MEVKLFARKKAQTQKPFFYGKLIRPPQTPPYTMRSLKIISMASQAHGFIWEDAIKRNVFHLTEVLPYTAIFDVPAERNPLNPQENVSIKCAGGDKAECGDAGRIFTYRDAVVTLVHAQYSQRDEQTKALDRVREFSLGGAETHRILFGDVTQEEVNHLRQMIHAVPAGPIAAATKAAIHAEKSRLNAKSGAIRFNPKMDSKKQRRLQCSIPKLSAFLAANPNLLISDTTEALVRGISIPATIASARRLRATAAPAPDSAPHSPLA